MTYIAMGSATSTRTAHHPQTQTRPQLKTKKRRSFRVEESYAFSVLSKIELLGEDWDGYGAAAPLPDAVRNAKLALWPLLDAGLYPEITPNTDGTISLEWEGSDFEAEVQIGTKRFSMYLAHEDAAASYFKGEVKGGSDFGAGVAALRRIVNPESPFGKARFQHV